MRVEHGAEAARAGPGACVCNPTFLPTFVASCNGPCQSTTLDEQTCSNQDTATRVGTLPPVCTTHPSTSARSIGRVLFGDRSICEIGGTLSVVRGDDDPVSTTASGVVEIEGAPCPGTGCGVRVLYRLAGDGELSFDDYGGLASATFSDIRVSGGTVSPTVVDGAGNGEVAASALSTSGRGTRDDEVIIGGSIDTERASYIGTNVEPVDVGVDWAGHECALVGSLLDAEVEGDPTDIVLDVGGTLVNQPPRANAGADQTIECDTAARSETLDLRDLDRSTDPDGTDDIAFRDWWVGHPGGAPIVPDALGVVSRTLGVGQSATYALSVTDSRIAISQDTVVVRVVDTTAPSVSGLSASPDRLFPLNHMMVPVTVSVTTSDTCGAASCRITAVSMNQPVDDLGDGYTEPDWVITGPLTVELRAESSAVRRNRIYTIEITCSDQAGNAAVRTVAVTVPVNR